MPLPAGETLQSRLDDQGTLDVKETTSSAEQIWQGLALFMLLSGRPPYEGRTITASLRQAAIGELPSLSEVAPEVPSWLGGLVSDLLEREPARRPGNARVVSERLVGRVDKISFVLRSELALLSSSLTGAEDE